MCVDVCLPRAATEGLLKVLSDHPNGGGRASGIEGGTAGVGTGEAAGAGSG
jgi:hypothetical protein